MGVFECLKYDPKCYKHMDVKHEPNTCNISIDLHVRYICYCNSVNILL